MLTSDQVCLYRAHRAIGRTPAAARTQARALNYRASPGLAHYTPQREAGVYYVERPDLAGLRLIGPSHEIVGLRHRGHYCDDTQDRTLYGSVYQLPSYKGRKRFIAAYQCSEEDGTATVDMTETFDNERDAALRAESFAESEAGKERDHNEAWRMGSDYQMALYSKTLARAAYLRHPKARRLLGMSAYLDARKEVARIADTALYTPARFRDGFLEGAGLSSFAW